MNKHCLGVLGLLICSAHVVSAETRPDPVEAELRQSFSTFLALWHDTAVERTKPYFCASPEPGFIDYKEAISRRGDFSKYCVLHSESNSEFIDQKLRIRVITVWVPQKANANDNLLPLRTEESFIATKFQGRNLIASFSSKYTTDEMVNAANAAVDKYSKIFENTGQPPIERCKAATAAYMDLWLSGQFDRMWPILKRLVDEEKLPQKGPKEMEMIREITRRTMNVATPPEEYRNMITTVVGNR